MYKKKMKNKSLLIIILTFLIVGCGNQNRKAEKFYTANSNFGGLPQKIEVSKLDSIINSDSIYRLNEYKTSDSLRRFAYQILKRDILKEKIDTSGLLIKWAKNLNDSVVEFRVCHLDDVIYEYYCKIGYPIPITGNISGYDGWYRINMDNGTMRIIITQ